MSGPIVRKYGFPNFEKIFGERELKHGAEPEAEKADEPKPAEAPPTPPASTPPDAAPKKP